MKIVLLGTNGWYDTATGSTPCVLVQTPDYDIVFDAGNGFSKIDQYISGEKPVFLFLSHFHLDHLQGLHTLAKDRFDSGLRIFGRPGIKRVLNGFFSPTYTVPLKRLRFNVSFEEFSKKIGADLPFEITALPLIHNGPCQGYRLTIEGSTLTYCTDTGYCKNAVALARGADLFLCESAVAPGMETNPKWPHLNPAQSAQIALEAGAKQLVLIHFDPAAPPQLRADAEAEARRIFPNTIAGRDGLTFDI